MRQLLKNFKKYAIAFALGAIFVALYILPIPLKLFGVITLSWWWIALPFIVPVVLLSAIVLLMNIIIAVGQAVVEKQLRLRRM